MDNNTTNKTQRVRGSARSVKKIEEVPPVHFF